MESIVDEPWKIAAGNDFAYKGTTGDKPLGTDMFNRYVARLVKRTHDDGDLTEAFFRVLRLEWSATSLLRPSILWRVFKPQLQSHASRDPGDSQTDTNTTPESAAD